MKNSKLINLRNSSWIGNGVRRDFGIIALLDKKITRRTKAGKEKLQCVVSILSTDCARK